MIVNEINLGWCWSTWVDQHEELKKSMGLNPILWERSVCEKLKALDRSIAPLILEPYKIISLGHDKRTPIVQN